MNIDVVNRLRQQITGVSEAIARRANEPQTRIALVIYLLASGYLVFHVVFLDHINPISIAAFIVWALL